MLCQCFVSVQKVYWVNESNSKQTDLYEIFVTHYIHYDALNVYLECVCVCVCVCVCACLCGLWGHTFV